jgi:hypothetical protein
MSAIIAPKVPVPASTPTTLEAASDAWEAAVVTYERSPGPASKSVVLEARRALDAALRGGRP